MKILLLTLEYWPEHVGGVARYLDTLVHHWPKDDEVFVLTHTRLDLRNEGNVRWTKLVENHKFGWWKMFGQTRDFIKQNKIDTLIISHVVPVGYIAYLQKKVYGTPYVVILHGLDIALTTQSWWKKFLTKIILKNAKLIIANSQDTISIVNRNYHMYPEIVYPALHDEKPEVNQNLVDKLKDKYDLAGKKVILTVGRLVERKGQDKIIEALPEVIKKIPDLKYIIVGRGEYQEHLQKIARQLNIEDKIIFVTRAEDDELNAWYQICDIFVMVSRILNQSDREGFGIVYLEAAYFQRPSIAGKFGGAMEAVINGETGLLVDSHSPAEIAQAIIKLLQDDDLRKHLGEQGKMRVEREFLGSQQSIKVRNLLLNKSK